MHAGTLQGKECVATRSDQTAAVRCLTDPVLVVNRIGPASRIYRISVIEQVCRSTARDVKVRQCREHVFRKGQPRNQTRVRLDLIRRKTGIVKVGKHLRGLYKRLTGFWIHEV